MALPIFAMFIKKVYETPELGYSETEDFDMSNQFVATSDEGKYEGEDEVMDYGTDEEDGSGESEVESPAVEVGIDGIFD